MNQTNLKNQKHYLSLPFPLPSREQFHREYAGEITIWDFDTTYGSTYRNRPFTRIEIENRKKCNERRR